MAAGRCSLGLEPGEYWTTWVLMGVSDGLLETTGLGLAATEDAAALVSVRAFDLAATEGDAALVPVRI